MKKIAISILLLAFVGCATVSYAAVPSPSTLGQPIKVADVNIVDSKIVSQSDRTFTISFGLSNGTGVQTGVKYGIRLQRPGEKAQYIADEKIYDETLTLQENSVITRQITYTAPAQLSGDYLLLVTSQNTSGFPFGIAPVGTVSLAASQGIFIDPATCTVSAGLLSGKSIMQPVVINSADSLSVQCTFANTSSAPVTVQPVFETRFKSAYGDIAPTTGDAGSAFAIASGEKKVVTLQVPKPEKPQQYVALLHANAIGAKVSNTVVIPYVVSGATATIQNATLDKAIYSKGEQATVSVVYNTLQVDQNATISVALTSRTASCAPAVDQQLSATIGPVLTIPIAVTKQCAHPQVAVSIKNGDGTVLDQKTFGETSTPAKSQTTAIIVIAIAAIFAGAYLLRKKHPVAATMVLMLVVGLLPMYHASAATYTYTPSGWRGSMSLTVNVDRSPATFAAGELIGVSAYYVSNSPDSFPVYLTASTTGVGSTTLMPVSSLAPYAYSGVLSGSFPAPSTGGQKTVDFQVYNESRLIMGSTSNFSTSAQACTLGDPNSHGYYQALPYNPNGPSIGSYMYLSPDNYTSGIKINGGNMWLAMQYFFSGLMSTGGGWSYASPTYAVQLDGDGRVVAVTNC